MFNITKQINNKFFPLDTLIYNGYKLVEPLDNLIVCFFTLEFHVKNTL